MVRTRPGADYVALSKKMKDGPAAWTPTAAGGHRMAQERLHDLTCFFSFNVQLAVCS
jgi:hypothetical protein